MDIVYAKDFVRVASDRPPFVPGSHWPADDPFVLTHPDLFSTDPRYHLAFTEPRPEFFGDVEEATANPGERRSVRRPSSA